MSTENLYTYAVAGVTLGSGIPLPELVECTSTELSVDISVAVTTFELGVSEPSRSSYWYNAPYQASDSEFLLQIPDVADYLISEGREITIRVLPNASEMDVRVFLLGTVLAICLLQSGRFLLHASVVDINGKAVAFTGDSGFGKSTMAASFHSKGRKVLTDDICFVSMEQGQAYAYPSFPRIKLWDDALEALGESNTHLPRDYSRENKYHLPVTQNFAEKRIPLAAIFVLEYAEQACEPYLRPLSVSEGVTALRRNTYRHEFISDMGLLRNHFSYCTELVTHIDMGTLVREKNHHHLSNCVALVEGYTASLD